MLYYTATCDSEDGMIGTLRGPFDTEIQRELDLREVLASMDSQNLLVQTVIVMFLETKQDLSLVATRTFTVADPTDSDEIDELLTETQRCDRCEKVLPYNGDWYCGFCPKCADETEEDDEA